VPGQINLDNLLRDLNPVLDADEFVYCSVAEVAGHPVCVFHEREGITLVLRRGEAERLGLAFTFPCRMITLNIHSSLEAVGLLAAVTAALAARGISVNAVSAFYHDYLFVPVERAQEALQELRTIRRNPR
jgi:uncharacterized protein